MNMICDITSSSDANSGPKLSVQCTSLIRKLKASSEHSENGRRRHFVSTFEMHFHVFSLISNEEEKESVPF